MVMPYFLSWTSYFAFLSPLSTSLKYSMLGQLAVKASKGCLLFQEFETTQDRCGDPISYPAT